MLLALTFEVIKFLLPAIVLYFTVHLIVRAYLKNEEMKRAVMHNPEKDRITLPLRLQAYERLILLLERMTPAQLISRTLQPGMTAGSLHLTLLQVTREEFEHNVAQQIYVSSDGWLLTKKAREEVILLINKKAAETGPDATASDLAKNILESWGELDENPIQTAIEVLKVEVVELR